MEITNKVTTGTTSLTGWNVSPGTGGAATRTVEGDELVYTQTTASTGATSGPYLRQYFTEPLDRYSSRIQFKAAAGKSVRLACTVRNGTTDVTSKSTGFITATGGWQDLVVEDIDIAAPFTYFQVWVQVNGAQPVGELIRVRRVAIYDSPVAVPYFDGDSPRGPVAEGSPDWYTHRWLAAAGASESVRTQVSPHRLTRRWWDGLPQTYRKYDMSSDYQLLRFMDGMGSVAGDVEDISLDMYDGTLMDPRTTPDAALRWLSMLMGLPVNQRAATSEELRATLVSLVENGRPPVGTRAGVAEAVKRFLIGDKQVFAVPTPGEPYVISVLVRLDEVPDNDLVALKEKIMALGVIPAGHTVEIREAISIWEDWNNMTWAQKNAAIKTWVDATSHGVQL